jgi:hypothetical protein
VRGQRDNACLSRQSTVRLGCGGVGYRSGCFEVRLVGLEPVNRLIIAFPWSSFETYIEGTSRCPFFALLHGAGATRQRPLNLQPNFKHTGWRVAASAISCGSRRRKYLSNLQTAALPVSISWLSSGHTLPLFFNPNRAYYHYHGHPRDHHALDSCYYLHSSGCRGKWSRFAPSDVRDARL